MFLPNRCARAGLHGIARLDRCGCRGSAPGRLARGRSAARRAAPKPGARLGRASRLVGLGACAREVVGALVHAVPGVALDPLEGDAAPFHGAVDLLDELQVLDGLLVGFRPAALLPAEPPLGHDVDCVLRVGEDVQLFAGLGRGLKQTQNGG